YVSGYVIDRFGRVWGAVPGLIGLTAGHLLLALSNGSSAAFEMFLVATVVLAMANGVSSGIVMTLASDLAPLRQPAQFLGAFRFISGLGFAAAPLVLSGLTAAASLAGASLAMGGVGILGIAMMAYYVPK